MTDNLPALMSFDHMLRLADSIAKSRMFGMQTPDQALVLMAIAQAEGRHPALAARDYDIIAGRPAKKAEAMQRDFLAAGGSIKWHKLSDTEAEATFSHPQGGEVTLKWDMERAQKAGVFNSNPNYKKYPRQMLRSRLVSEGARTVFPAATSGMYVPEEVDDFQREPLNVTPPKKVEAQVDTWRAERDDRPTETTWADAGLDLAALIAQGNVACRDEALLKDWWQRHLRPDQRGVLGAKGKGLGPYLPRWKEGEIQTIQSAPSPTAQSPEAAGEVPHTPTPPPPGEPSEDDFGLTVDTQDAFVSSVVKQAVAKDTLDGVQEIKDQWYPQARQRLDAARWSDLETRIGEHETLLFRAGKAQANG